MSFESDIADFAKATNKTLEQATKEIPIRLFRGEEFPLWLALAFY